MEKEEKEKETIFTLAVKGGENENKQNFIELTACMDIEMHFNVPKKKEPKAAGKQELRNDGFLPNPLAIRVRIPVRKDKVLNAFVHVIIYRICSLCCCYSMLAINSANTQTYSMQPLFKIQIARVKKDAVKINKGELVCVRC